MSDDDKRPDWDTQAALERDGFASPDALDVAAHDAGYTHDDGDWIETVMDGDRSVPCECCEDGVVDGRPCRACDGFGWREP